MQRDPRKPMRRFGGTHTFRLEYYEITGFSELTFNIQKRTH
jgi:hypothetical protein